MFFEFWIDLLMYQGGLDDLVGVYDFIVCCSEVFGIDFEVEVVVIIGDVLMGIELVVVVESICLIMLVNDVLLCNLILVELGKGFGFFQSKFVMVFLFVVVMFDELGEVWCECKVYLLMMVCWNNKKVGQFECGIDMVFDFGQLIVYICKMCNVWVGSIVGLGMILNVDCSKGYVCIVEKCMLEIIEFGVFVIEYMCYGDIVKIEMFDVNGVFIFGVIDQEVIVLGMQV